MLEHRGQGAVNEFARELPWRFKVSAFWVVSLNLKLKVTLPPDLFSLLKHMWHRGRKSKGEKERWSQGAQRAQIKVSWELSVNTKSFLGKLAIGILQNVVENAILLQMPLVKTHYLKRILSG